MAPSHSFISIFSCFSEIFSCHRRMTWLSWQFSDDSKEILYVLSNFSGCFCHQKWSDMSWSLRHKSKVPNIMYFSQVCHDLFYRNIIYMMSQLYSLTKQHRLFLLSFIRNCFQLASSLPDFFLIYTHFEMQEHILTMNFQCMPY